MRSFDGEVREIAWAAAEGEQTGGLRGRADQFQKPFTGWKVPREAVQAQCSAVLDKSIPRLARYSGAQVLALTGLPY